MASFCSINTTLFRPTTPFPKVVTHVQPKERNRTSRLFVSAQRNDDTLEYEKLVNDLVPISNDFLDAKKKRIEIRVDMWKQDALATKEAGLAWYSWALKRQEVTMLQHKLGIVVSTSSEEQEEVFIGLKKKFDEVKMEVGPANARYKELWRKRVEIGKQFESEEEILAWEKFEKKKLEMMELQVKMYLLKPGMDFDVKA